MLKDLKEFTRKSLWLAVVMRRNKMKVAASSKDPQEALKKAKEKGYAEASLIKSSDRYASWVT